MRGVQTSIPCRCLHLFQSPEHYPIFCGIPFITKDKDKFVVDMTLLVEVTIQRAALSCLHRDTFMGSRQCVRVQ